MKNLLCILALTIIPFVGQSQDTVAVFVINNTNKLVKINDGYSFFYRDLKKVKQIRELKFESKSELEAFFNKAFDVLDTDISFFAKGYTIDRGKVNKNSLKVRKKDNGYFIIKRNTLENMQKATNK